MSEENLHLNNPLHGVGLKTMLEELVNHYGFEILYSYLNMKCFKANPSIAASAKFLKKTEWARQKVELFYLYQYKNLPAVSSEQFNVPPRERIVPEDQKPGQPAKLRVKDHEPEASDSAPVIDPPAPAIDPWANYKNRKARSE